MATQLTLSLSLKPTSRKKVSRCLYRLHPSPRDTIIPPPKHKYLSNKDKKIQSNQMYFLAPTTFTHLLGEIQRAPVTQLGSADPTYHDKLSCCCCCCCH